MRRLFRRGNSMHLMSRLLSTVATLVVASAAVAQPLDAGVARSAKELNAEGYEFYKAWKWQSAADRFKDAFTANPKLAIAHYNFAATAFRALQYDGCAGVSYPLTEAVDHLARSLQLDQGRLNRLKVDPDFAEFRQTVGYFSLLGADTHSAAGIAAVLPKLKLRAPSNQDSGPAFELQFHQSGVVDVLDHDLDGLGGSWTWVKRRGRGTWRIKQAFIDGGRSILLELSAPTTRYLPALNFSGTVTVGPLDLVLKDEKNWPFFAADAWVVCCC